MRDAFKGLDKIEILGYPIRLGITIFFFFNVFPYICHERSCRPSQIDCEIKLVSIKIIANK